MIQIFLTFACLLTLSLRASSPVAEPNSVERAKVLKEYLRKEKAAFTRRESERRDLVEALDKLNSKQNEIRERIADVAANEQELTMALENLSLEYKKQKDLAGFEKQRLLLLFKIVYKIKKDGIIRFVVAGENLGHLGSRLRILYRTLRSHSMLTRQLQERANHLKESEEKLAEAEEDQKELLNEVSEQESLLKELLDKKSELLGTLNQKQSYYQTAQREYKQVSSQLSALFNNFQSLKDADRGLYPKRGSLPPPVDIGRIVKTFGKSVNERFGTVVYQKGLEIESEQNAPVRAILPGEIEYEGWVKGLGNVVIVHHGGGFYSLSAHLHKALKAKGEEVNQGEPIGLVGDTGDNDKPSLYFEIRENSKAVNPIAYFSEEAMEKLN
jgi:murein hydrolase activator